MGDKFRRVQPNQKVAIAAPTWNAMIDAAKAHELSKFNVGSGDDPLWRQADICKVLNQSGGTLDQFSVVELSNALITPAQNEAEFKARAAFQVITPTSKARGKFGVLLEPIPAGRIGRAWASGVCPAMVNVIDEKHRYCEAAAGSTSLRSDCFGSARILWRETGLGLKWALIRLGNRDDNGRLFRFSLFESLASGEAVAELFTMEGAPFEDDDIAPIIRDPEGIFPSLEEGDRGLAIRQCDRYWVIQAKCPQKLGGEA